MNRSRFRLDLTCITEAGGTTTDLLAVSRTPPPRPFTSLACARSAALPALPMCLLAVATLLCAAACGDPKVEVDTDSSMGDTIDASGGDAADADAGPPVRTELRVISWNLCGEAGGARGDAGFCPYRNEPWVKIAEIGALVATHHANVILLQEVCGEASDSHLGLLEGTLGAGWSIRHARAQRTDGRSDCRGSLTGEYGVAIAVADEIVAVTSANTVPDPSPTDTSQATFPILCVQTRHWTTRICTTHVLADPSDPRRPGQVVTIRDYVASEQVEVVVGGDFNLFPDSTALAPMNDTFDECDRSAHSEGDATNEFTHHAWNGNHIYRKRDHIFASPREDGSAFSFCDSDQNRMDQTPNTAEAGPPDGFSDHAPLIGVIRP